MNSDIRFYFDVAKFFFAAAAGSTAGYILIKSADGAMSRAVPMVEVAVASRLAGEQEAVDVLDTDETD